MLQQLIQEKLKQVSYSPDEIDHIAIMSERLGSAIRQEADFGKAFAGGAYQRQTLVKKVGEVELYFEYKNLLDAPQSALSGIHRCLHRHYPEIRFAAAAAQHKIEFNQIRFRLIPFICDPLGNVKIPADDVSGWKIAHHKPLEEKIKKLAYLNRDFLDLIKLIKYWNYTHQIGLADYRIEEVVYTVFVTQFRENYQYSDWLWTFFNEAPCYLSRYDFESFHLFQQALGSLNYARDKMYALMMHSADGSLFSEWSAFIENMG